MNTWHESVWKDTSWEIVRAERLSMKDRGWEHCMESAGCIVCPEAVLPMWYAECVFRGFIRAGNGDTAVKAETDAIGNVKRAYLEWMRP